MSTVLDNAILVGKETTYGTAVTLTRGYEAKSDTWVRKQEFLESKGMRTGAQAQRTGRSRAINMGGEGSIECDVLSNGFGLIAQATLGAVSGPTLVSGTAYKTTCTTTTDDPNDSWTIQALRADAAGTLRQFTHKGCVITEWGIKQDVGGLLMFDGKFDFQDVDTSTAAAASPSTLYPTGAAAPFDWTMASATWNSVAVDIKSFALNAKLSQIGRAHV